MKLIRCDLTIRHIMFSACFDIKKEMGRENIKEASKILNNVSFGSSFNSELE